MRLRIDLPINLHLGNIEFEGEPLNPQNLTSEQREALQKKAAERLGAPQASQGLPENLKAQLEDDTEGAASDVSDAELFGSGS